MKRCINCWEEKYESQFGKKQSRCKVCRNAKVRKEYRHDIGVSRLEGRIRWNDQKARIRRLIKFMERYTKLLDPYVK